MTQRGIIFLLCFIFSSPMLFCAEGIPSKKVLVSKIKILLDEEEVKSPTILSYTKFRENKTFSQKAIQKEVERTKIRLMNSGLFYSAQVEAHESRKNPETIVIYISARTGFLLRFGGGNAYGFFGKVGLGGKRNMLAGYLGYNKTGASYIDENTFGLPLIFGAKFFTNAAQSIAKKEPLAFDAYLKTGFFAGPDIRLGVDTRDQITVRENKPSLITISPYFYYTLLFSEKFIANAELRSFNNSSDDFKSDSIEAAINLDFNPNKKITLAGLLSGGAVIYSSEDVKINLEKTSIDLYDGLGLANRGIRSGYTKEELETDSYGLFSAEIRWNALDFNMPPAFPVTFAPYLFTDLALAQDYSAKDNRFLDAYGLGLLINFDCPVFAYFNLSYGINHERKGKFVFAAMQSF